MRHGRLLTALGVLALVVFSATVGIAKDRSGWKASGKMRLAKCPKKNPHCQPPPPTTTTPPPTTTVPPPPPGNLRPVDGGPNYYSQFSNPIPSGTFPLAVWLSSAFDQSTIDKYKAFGLNGLVGVSCPECTDEGLLRANGFWDFIQSDERTRFDDIGSETAGWLLYDEIDMCCGPPGFDGGNGYNILDSIRAGLPQDNRLRFNNYGKGVMFWETDQQAAQFINQYQDVVSDDIYWFTDPNAIGDPGYGKASSYGATVDRIRFLDSLDGKRQPVWNAVELGWPFTESASQGGRRILPAEARAAVWQSIIAGARGIIYFDHNFGPGTPGSTVQGSGYSDTTAMISTVNAQITQLAPVLNSPFEDGFAQASTVRLMTKNLNGQRYIFAGSSGGASNPTFTVAGGSTATVLFENRSIPIISGQFSDSFSDGNAVHIYRID